MKVRWRIALFVLQAPLTFVCGALMGPFLSDPVVIVIALAYLVGVVGVLYGWLLSLAAWQYQSGCLYGAHQAAEFIRRKVDDGA